MFKKLRNKNVLFVALCLGLSSAAKAEEIASAENSVSTSQPRFFSKEKWGASYLNYMNGPTFSDSNGGSINHLITLKHKLNSDWGLSLTVRPDSNFGNEERSLTMGDPYVKLNYPTLYKNENGLKISGDLTYYAPISESSKKAKISGAISPRIITSYEAGQFSFIYLLSPKAYLNTTAIDGQRTFSHAHYLATGYKLSSRVTLDFALYPAWTMKRNKPTAFNDLPALPGMTVSINKKLSFSPYVAFSALKPDAKTSAAGGVLSYTFL